MWPRYLAVTMSYGLVRNASIMSSIPMKPDELYTDRLAVVGMCSACSPMWWPFMMGSDLQNIERKMRGLKVKPFIPFLNVSSV